MITHYYAFDHFKLFPEERRLVDESQSEDIRVQNRCLDLLIALVKNSGHLMSRNELMNRAWGQGTNIELGNLNTHVSSLRKLLGDNDVPPRLIETVHGKGYRFRAKVTKGELDDDALPPAPSRMVEDFHTPFEAEAHRFVPTYVGIPISAGVERSTRWGGYRELLFKDARLCIMNNGVAVWHIQDTLQFPALTDLAYWRRDAFRSILSGSHSINGLTAKLVSKGRKPTLGILERFAGKFEYALSMFALGKHQWSDKQLRAALELASCPRVLLPDESSMFDDSAARLREMELLESDYAHPDSRQFGAFGADFGCANWGGVSYHGFRRNSSEFVEGIFAFEVALQSLWLFCHLIKKVADVGDPEDRLELESAASMIRADFGRIQDIGPTDLTAIRTMCEAILTTSRIQSVVGGTLEAISRHRREYHDHEP
jgi:DNA-binding winged helix-turn-helix (wHTH) protein